ncbi:DUF4214 domain-containing protein [uncultured Rhizobium sp.]|uniref:DUF4214 domain-containing protein n=1 Tax=uncultured Rhizobium sp. TaxID=155567 RepID=UPI00260C600E|nr:DUF4214 domain-containing protein [uncultured Rhizobium sp.]
MASIQGIYVALFGRPADPAGLQYFNTATNNGANLNAIGDLAATAEYQDRFKGMDNAGIVTAIYQSLFGRNPELAGLTFFVDALNKGTININNVAINILDGAKGDDLATVNNKVTAANAFTAAIDTPDELAAYRGDAAAAQGRAFLSPITSDASTVPSAAATDAAVEGVVKGGGVEGSVFTLTADADTFTPTSADAKFQTTANDDTFRAVAVGDLKTVDFIDGGAGRDTLNAVVSGASIEPVLKSVEVVNLSVETADATFSANSSTGVEEIWFKANDGHNLTLDDVSLSTKVGFATDADLTVNFAGVSGAADTANIVLAAADGALAVASVETLNLASTVGANNVVVSGDSIAHVVLTGDKAVTLDLTAAAVRGTIESVDGSAATGAETIKLNGALANDVSVKTGTGADTVNLAGATVKVTVDTAAGNDTISVTGDKAHSLTTGDGNDTVNVATVVNLGATDITTAAKLEAAAIKIDLSSSDTLNLTGTAGNKVVLTGTDLSLIEGKSDLKAAIAEAVTHGGAQHDVYAFQFDGHSYIYVDNDATAGLSAGDGLIDITGNSTLDASHFTVA